MKKLLGVLILLWLSYLVWASWGKEDLNPPADTTFRIEDEFGTNQGKGNLIGIQPYMMPIDYANEKAFFNKMNGYFEQLKEKEWLSAKSIVVLPEYLGTWLVTAHEKSSLYAANSLGKGLQVMVSSHLFSFGKEYLFAPEQIKDKTKYAVFALKADEMASIYQKTFSDLARRYGVTIVAGSILLPDPRVEAGQLVVGKGAENIPSIPGVTPYNINDTYEAENLPKVSDKAEKSAMVRQITAFTNNNFQNYGMMLIGALIGLLCLPLFNKLPFRKKKTG